jgi:hypothetical protein
MERVTGESSISWWKLQFWGCTPSIWQYPGMFGKWLCYAMLPKTATLINSFDLGVCYFQTNHIVRLGAKSDPKNSANSSTEFGESTLHGELWHNSLIIHQMSPTQPVVLWDAILRRFSCPSSRRGSRVVGVRLSGPWRSVSTERKNPPKSTCDESLVERIKRDQNDK